MDLGDMDITRGFGEGSSPLLVDDRVVLNWDHEGDSFLVALNKTTGQEVWRQERPGGTSWVTPVVSTGEAGPEIVIVGGTTIAYALSDGHEVWRLEPAEVEAAEPTEGGFGRGGRGGARRGSGVIASPVLHEGLLLYSTGSRGGAFQAIRLAAGEGDATRGSLAWSHEGDTPHVPSPIAFEGILYSLKGNSGQLLALDVATGEVLYGPTRMQGIADAYASPIGVDERLYFFGRDGTSEVVKAGPEFETLAVNVLDDRFDASPAVAGNALFLRGYEHVYCIAE